MDLGPESPKITVLICSLSEVGNLLFVFPKISDWVDEMLITDGHSTQGIVEVAKAFYLRARILPYSGRGKRGTLRYGIQQARKDIITLDTDWGDGFTIQILICGGAFARLQLRLEYPLSV